MRRMRFRLLVGVAVAVLASTLPSAASRDSDPQINDKIRQEEGAHSQIMRTIHFLSDVYGPRLTGSPNHKAAAEWAVKQMTDWGLTNGAPRAVGVRASRAGSNEHLEVHMISPMHDALVVQALAWTPGTNGTVNAQAFNLVPPQGPMPRAAAAPAADAAPQRRAPPRRS